jgi:glutamyl-tRNA(Gln) amidotransferase subunit E
MNTEFLGFDDYRRVGLRCGLEVHQQLKTEHKLFCKCPNTAYTDRYDAEILRHMRPTLSEMGEYDRTALMEFRTRKEILYRLNRERICTYEIDDAPPFGLNREALDIAIEIALLFQCNIVGEIHIARKQYLDGSIPTGFQRTMIVGLDGWFPLDGRRIGVRQISLEEDACREVSDIGHTRTYYTDRLCVPLIEVVTDPDFRTPEEAFRGAETIRRVTRVTNKVRRGPGSTRQDTNVSVSGGDRVEVKGVPSTSFIPHLVHWEAVRQRALIQIAATLAHRSLTKDDFAESWVDVTPLMRLTRFTPIRNVVESGGVAYVVRLPRYKGILGHSLGRDRRFVDELRDRVRVVACLDGQPNLLYSEDPAASIAQRIWRRASASLGASENDTVVLLWGPERDVITAAEEVVRRCRDALDAVLPDTRQVELDGTTRFERVLAGPNRMYPDTDMPPVAVSADHLARIEAGCPALPWERYEVLTKECGLPHDAADALILDGNADLYLRAVRECDVSTRFASHMLTNAYRRLQRRWEAPEDIPETAILDFFSAYASGRFTREVAYDVLSSLAHDPGAGLDGALQGVPLRRERSTSELDALVHPRLEEERSALGEPLRDVAEHIAMGLVMPDLIGQTPGAEVRESVARWFDQEEVSP